MATLEYTVLEHRGFDYCRGNKKITNDVVANQGVRRKGMQEPGLPFTIPVRSKFGRSCQILGFSRATLGVLDTATAANWSGVTISNYCREI
jgi:hypothetical protein